VHEAQQALELTLADTRLYEAAAKEELQQLLRRKARLDDDCETAEAAWLEAAEALEQATSPADTAPED
jgi:ATP-binding cassette subfamily F protein 3